jgi:aspartyl-tRNA(Asn)/glutamyl-tRNA(Gln) amidotransferase subunit C
VVPSAPPFRARFFCRFPRYLSARRAPAGTAAAMSLDRTTVKNIAFLARIKVPDEDLDDLAGELSNILGWVEQLGEVDTDGVAPMTSVTEMTPAERHDEVNDGDDQERVLANAPEREDGFYTVPKVVE